MFITSMADNYSIDRSMENDSERRGCGTVEQLKICHFYIQHLANISVDSRK